ncbi:hypothetical protein NDU88_005258 [Pleurodeles waltl]|uniref:Uncharacterized protein n=1 Tax=Pleurodeles waltl TaxID=8319 RepID=A0AAV7M8S0_PLEWA|nr:hypothetical protein NDU88_005258 [Pleurodeles waltl]
MRQLEVKYGMFKPARLWVTRNGVVSKDFCDLEDLQIFLDGLQPKSMDNQPQTSLCKFPATKKHLTSNKQPGGARPIRIRPPAQRRHAPLRPSVIPPTPEVCCFLSPVETDPGRSAPDRGPYG